VPGPRFIRHANVNNCAHIARVCDGLNRHGSLTFTWGSGRIESGCCPERMRT
jgi:hypothetical protein